MYQRLQHDAAFALAANLLAIVENCLRPEERRDAFESFLVACKDAFVSYEIQKRRENFRLTPSRN